MAPRKLLIVVDAHSGIPVYRQLIDQIRFHVASGLLAPGDEIPSTRGLSAQLGVNPMTISKAYSLLEADGVLERRAGLPLIVRDTRGASGQSAKLAQLRTALRPIATMVRQLGIDKRRALGMFRKILDESER